MLSNQLTIKEITDHLRNKNFILPAIQRSFVWKPAQIEKLFDSLMQDYPIGSILLWHLQDQKKIRSMKFYECPNQFTKGQAPRLADNPLWKDEVYAVLDGQQRLTSIYIATQGFYAEPSRSNKQNYNEKELYIDLLYSPRTDDTEDTEKYKFKFLEKKRVDNLSDKEYWYSVKEIIKWKNQFCYENVWENIIQKHPNLNNQNLKIQICETLSKLWVVLNKQPILPYYKIDSSKELAEVLEIFVRVNSQGIKLTKTDLLLSTMIPYWENVREEFNDLSSTSQNYGFILNQDVIMKTAFACIDKNVVFRLENFNDNNTKEIQTNWKDIKEAILKSVEILKEFGFRDENIPAYNAIIPIAYYLYNNKNSETQKKSIHKYFILSLLKKVFGRASDNTIDKMVKILKDTSSFEQIMQDKEFKGQYKVTTEDIEKWITLPKGQYTFLLLSLIYPKIDYARNKFDQDHIHPKAKFKDKYLKEQGVPTNRLEEWKEQYDTLPNLQILEGGLNRKKNASYLKDWLKEENIPETKFKEDNLIDTDISLEFKDFDSFYKNRKEKIKQKLQQLFL